MCYASCKNFKLRKERTIVIPLTHCFFEIWKNRNLRYYNATATTYVAKLLFWHQIAYRISRSISVGTKIRFQCCNLIAVQFPDKTKKICLNSGILHLLNQILYIPGFRKYLLKRSWWRQIKKTKAIRIHSNNQI